jgi:hypothetical protein
MVTRAAVIIGSPGHAIEAPPLLVGVQADITSYGRFFLSDEGGAWEPTEVHQAFHPSVQELRRFLASLHVQYSITVFCGHGFRSDGKAAIQINPREAMWVADFRTQAQRQLTIIDACQMEEQPERLTEDSFGHEVGAGLGRPPDLYRPTCRALYDASIESVGAQRTIMYGCNIGQTAGENPEGGYFSQTLLGICVDWAARQRAESPVLPSYVKTVRDVFNATASTVTQNYYPQQPMLESGRSPQAFPFLVA